MKINGENAFFNSNIKEMYFSGKKPEFEVNSFQNLNVSIFTLLQIQAGNQ